MNYDSVLNGTELAGESRELIGILQNEIEFYKYEIEAIRTFIESENTGESASALKAKAAQVIELIKVMIDADESDIRDFEILSETVDQVNIDGYEVLTLMEDARRNANDCYAQADDYYRKAVSSPISAISDHFYDLSRTYRDHAASWERIYETLRKIEHQYDEIDFETADLFTSGNELRNGINNMAVLLGYPAIPKKTVPQSPNITNTKALSPEKLRDEELKLKYFFLYDYLKNTIGASEYKTMEILKELKEKNRLESFWAAYNYDKEGYNRLLNDLELKEKYDFLYNHLTNEMQLSENDALAVLKELKEQHRLESFWATYHYSQKDYSILVQKLDLLVFEKMVFKKWENVTDEFIRSFNFYLDKYDISDPASIQMFLAVCMHESGRGQWTVELADGGSNYGSNEKGVGYIQLSLTTNHIDFLRYMGDDYSGENTTEYINKTYDPWEVSAWYWRNKIDENSMFKEYGNNPNVFLYTSYKVNGFPDSRDIFVNLLLEENKTWRYDENTNTIVIDDILCYDAPIGWEDRWRYYNYVMDIAKSI